MSATTPTTSDEVEADKLLQLDEGHVIAYEAYDGDLIKHDDREKRTYRKRVTNVTQLSEASDRVYVHVEDCETGDKTILSAAIRHTYKGIPYRTGSIKETMGPYAGHPDAWTRTVNNLRLVDPDE